MLITQVPPWPRSKSLILCGSHKIWAAWHCGQMGPDVAKWAQMTVDGRSLLLDMQVDMIFPDEISTQRLST